MSTKTRKKEEKLVEQQKQNTVQTLSMCYLHIDYFCTGNSTYYH